MDLAAFPAVQSVRFVTRALVSPVGVVVIDVVVAGRPDFRPDILPDQKPIVVFDRRPPSVLSINPYRTPVVAGRRR